jgi:CheY-like chemotaxis protein
MLPWHSKRLMQTLPRGSFLAPRGGMTLPRLLLIDDDALFLRTFTRVLAAEFNVSCASGAESALASIDASAGVDWYDVILCDLGMPRMGGQEMYRELVKRQSKLAARMLILTGAAAVDGDAFAAHMGERYLMKMGKVDDLKALLRRTAHPRLTNPLAPLAAA